MSGNASKIAADLENTLAELTSMVEKDAAALNSAIDTDDDGNQPHSDGALVRENISDVKKQQDIGMEHESGTADSPAFNNAADETGDITETDADADGAKPHSDDPGTSHPARVDKEASADDFRKAASVIDALAEDLMSGSTDGDQSTDKSEKAAEEDDEDTNDDAEEGGDHKTASAEGDSGKADDAAEKVASVADLLPEGVDPAAAAAIPTLPTDADELQKFAADNDDALADYTEKCASVYADDVRVGFLFAAQFDQGLQHMQKAAAERISNDPEAQVIAKLAMEDAENVAELMGGMAGEAPPEEEGEVPAEGGEAPLEEEAGEVLPEEGAPEAVADSAEEIPAEAAMAAPEEAQMDPAMGMEGAPGDDILAALLEGGIDPAMLGKVASASGLDAYAVAAKLTALAKKEK